MYMKYHTLQAFAVSHTGVVSDRGGAYKCVGGTMFCSHRDALVMRTNDLLGGTSQTSSRVVKTASGSIQRPFFFRSVPITWMDELIYHRHEAMPLPIRTPLKEVNFTAALTAVRDRMSFAFSCLHPVCESHGCKHAGLAARHMLSSKAHPENVAAKHLASASSQSLHEELLDTLRGNKALETKES